LLKLFKASDWWQLQERQLNFVSPQTRAHNSCGLGLS
jgi:hypothetical protein